MKILALQMDLMWEKPEENLQQVRSMLAEACSPEAEEWVVLPEMFNTGFSMDAACAVAAESETRSGLRDLAREFGVSMIAGLCVASGQKRPFNAALILNADGEEVGRYAKIHPFTLAAEEKSYERGDTLVTITASDGTRVTPLVCYDLRFPEVFRSRASDSDLFVVIANWPQRRQLAWETLLRARAIENQCYVLGVNRVGEGGGIQYSGRSRLYGPDGHADSESLPDGAAGILRLSVDADRVAQQRSEFSFLRDRRRDLYPNL